MPHSRRWMFFSTQRERDLSKRRDESAVHSLFDNELPKNNKENVHMQPASSKLFWRESGYKQSLPIPVFEAICSTLDILDNRLQTEGLWRECGDANRVKELALKLLGGSSPALAEDPHDVVGAIKQVMKEHEPLTTYTMCESFASEEVERVFPRLPAKPHRHLLCRLAAHFGRLVEVPESKMSWRAIGIALAPTLLRRDEEITFCLDAKLIEEAKKDAKLLARAAERILRRAARSPLQEPQKSAAARCVRLRRIGMRDDDTTTDSSLAEASVRMELGQWGLIKNVGFLPSRSSNLLTDAIVLFSEATAVDGACRAGQTKNWRISRLPRDSDTPRRRCESASPHASFQPQSHHQRIVRAYTASGATLLQGNNDIKGKKPKSSKKVKRLSFSMTDLHLLLDDDDNNEVSTQVVASALW